MNDKTCKCNCKKEDCCKNKTCKCCKKSCCC